MDIILLHGYNVTSTRTYGVLPQRLKSLGHSLTDVYLGKYVTLDDDLSLADLVRAFNAALEDTLGLKLTTKKYACLTHSTGALVARGWISTYFESNMRSCPFSHLIMLAPPNHGSRLASLGKSRLSRLRSLWGAEPGLKILDALELGSAFQGGLNGRWLEHRTFEAPGFFPAVIAGQWIDKKIWDIIIPATYERGSDGVVRAAAANLNMKKFVMDADGTVTSDEMTGIPFLIAPKTSHSDEDGIMGSIPAKGDHPVLTAIVRILEVRDRQSYKKLSDSFRVETEALQAREPYHDGSKLDRYSQLVIKIRDNMGNPLSDYAVELVNAVNRGDQFPEGFLAHGAQNTASAERYVYYLDYDQIRQVPGGRVGIKVQSVPHSPLVAYDELLFQGDFAKVDNLLAPNRTTYVDVTMRRRLNKKVFELTQNFSIQKIERKPGKDWID